MTARSDLQNAARRFILARERGGPGDVDELEAAAIAFTLDLLAGTEPMRLVALARDRETWRVLRDVVEASYYLGHLIAEQMRGRAALEAARKESRDVGALVDAVAAVDAQLAGHRVAYQRAALAWHLHCDERSNRPMLDVRTVTGADVARTMGRAPSCQVKACASAAALVVHWPSGDVLMCGEHAEHARGVGRVLGLNVATTEVPS